MLDLDICGIAHATALQFISQFEQIDLPDGINTISALAGWLQERNDTWRTALGDSRLHVAVNQKIVNPDCPVNDGDEVAWFPPVTGG